MMIHEKLEDFSFKYIFVKSFKWKAGAALRSYAGHPKNGDVYRTLYNGSSYKLMIDDEVGLEFLKLIDADEDSDHSCEMIEISKDNIIQIDLPENTLDKMLDWIESDNKDIKENFGASPISQSIASGLASLSLAIRNQSSEEAKAMDEAQAVMKALWLVNTSMFHLVVEVAEKLGQWTLSREELAVTHIALGKEGKGYNVANAIDCLDQYLEPIRKGGDDPSEIVEAIINLYQELERRDLLELDNEE